MLRVAANCYGVAVGIFTAIRRYAYIHSYKLLEQKKKEKNGLNNDEIRIGALVLAVF